MILPSITTLTSTLIRQSHLVSNSIAQSVTCSIIKTLVHLHNSWLSCKKLTIRASPSTPKYWKPQMKLKSVIINIDNQLSLIIQHIIYEKHHTSNNFRWEHGRRHLEECRSHVHHSEAGSRWASALDSIVSDLLSTMYTSHHREKLCNTLLIISCMYWISLDGIRTLGRKILMFKEIQPAGTDSLAEQPAGHVSKCAQMTHILLINYSIINCLNRSDSVQIVSLCRIITTTPEVSNSLFAQYIVRLIKLNKGLGFLGKLRESPSLFIKGMVPEQGKSSNI